VEGWKSWILSMATGQHDYCPWLVYLRGVRCPCWIETREWILVPKPNKRYCEVQTLRGIILLGTDFNSRIVALSNTIDTNDLCELLQVVELVKTKQPSIVTKRQNREARVSDWGHELLDLCCDIGLFSLNGRTPSDKLREFICLANGGRNTIDYIISSPVTHLKVIIDDTRYCMMGETLTTGRCAYDWASTVPLLSHNIKL
jgi:hypothetical protein